MFRKAFTGNGLAGWKTKRLDDVLKTARQNKDYGSVDEQFKAVHDVTWKWVRGHAGIEGNEIADQLANQGIEELRARIMRQVISRHRKQTGKIESKQGHRNHRDRCVK